MTTEVLGGYSFSEVPDYLGSPLMINAGNTPSVMSGITASMPTAGTVGAIYIATDTQLIYRDNGASWQVLSPSAVRQVISGNIPAISGTSLIPYDNTTPLSTEGTQIWTASITPAFTTSRIQINFSLHVDAGNATRNITVAVFRGTTCIGASTVRVASVGGAQILSMCIDDVPGVTSAVTYSARAGANTSTTWYINQGSTAVFNGLLGNNGYTLMEIT